MNADPTRIVMTETRCRNCGIPIVQVYHRDFAEMRGEGRFAEEAAGYLVNRLGSAIGDAVDPSLREAVRSARRRPRIPQRLCSMVTATTNHMSPTWDKERRLWLMPTRNGSS